MPRNFPRSVKDVLGEERIKSYQSESRSTYLAAIQPISDLIGVITPFTTHPVRWDAARTSPFSQRYWMYVDQFAQFGRGQSSIASTKVVDDVHLP